MSSRRPRLIEDVIGLAARLPWWVSLLLAGVLYIALHVIAGSMPAQPTSTAELGSFVVRQAIWTGAAILQYVLPLALIFGAAASVIVRRRGRVLLSQAAADPRGAIAVLSWQDFERLVAAGFERQGFAVTRTGAARADGGVDLVLAKGRELTLVQCKQWRAQKVGVATVRELYGVMAARGAAQGIVVSAGDFTADAREFARGRNIDLVNGTALEALLRGGGGGSIQGRISSPAPSPRCPRCGSGMVERVARLGQNAGQVFWGCETFPRCRGTLPVSDYSRRDDCTSWLNGNAKPR